MASSGSDTAHQLLELSRRAQWTFPTSAGPPLRPGDEEPWAEELLAARTDLAAVELHNLGHVELHRGNVDAARRLFDELAERGDSGDPYGAAMSHLNSGALAFAAGDREQAASELRSADAAITETAIEFGPRRSVRARQAARAARTVGKARR